MCVCVRVCVCVLNWWPEALNWHKMWPDLYFCGLSFALIQDGGGQYCGNVGIY